MNNVGRDLRSPSPNDSQNVTATATQINALFDERLMKPLPYEGYEPRYS
jgi:uncharacterized protein YukJ